MDIAVFEAIDRFLQRSFQVGNGTYAVDEWPMCVICPRAPTLWAELGLVLWLATKRAERRH